MTHSEYRYDDTDEHGTVLAFPPYIVAFDIDAPTPYFTQAPAGRNKALPRIVAFLDRWSTKYDLGQYWIYQTGNGWHALFEKPAGTLVSWTTCYDDAIWVKGWHECLGHWGLIKEECRATLRVGLKGLVGHVPRPPDISLVYGEVNKHSPLHVRTHYDALARYQVYKEV
jgi:hypothetical protein